MLKRLLNATLVLLVIAFAANVTAQTDPGMDNVTHWYSFDDGTANDMVGEAHGVVLGEAMIADGSLHIDTLDQWVELPADLIMVPEYEAISVTTWFTTMADSNNGFHMVVYFGDSNESGLGSNGFFISPCRGDDVSRAAISCLNEAEPWTAESGVNGPETNDGILHHMAVTIDDVQLEYYVDGQYMGFADLADDNKLWNISTNYAYIGRGGYSGDPVLRGQIHDVAIYNRRLTEEEVLYLYQNFPVSAVDSKIASVPQEFDLAQNYPNPFNPSTNIQFSLPTTSMVKLGVYNMLGQEIATLTNQVYQAGTFNVSWNGLDVSGQPAESGVYMYRLETEDQTLMKKMLLIK